MTHAENVLKYIEPKPVSFPQAVPLLQEGTDFIAQRLRRPQKGKYRGALGNFFFHGIAVKPTLNLDHVSYSVVTWCTEK